MISEKIRAKIKSDLIASRDENVIDIFGPVKYDDSEGILVLTDKQVIFAKEKGSIIKSYEPVCSVKLANLAETKLLDFAEIPKRITSEGDVEYISTELGQFTVRSPEIMPFVIFHNERIFSQVQKCKGLVKHGESWITPEEKERLYPPVYIHRSLVENPWREITKNMAKRICQEEFRCCVCGEQSVVFWIINALYMRKGKVTHAALFARLLCKKHEEKWKNGEILGYNKFNGVALLKILYYLPAEIEQVGMWVNMPWDDFWNMLNSYSEVALERSALERMLTQSAELVLGGELKDFLEGK